MLKMSFKKVFLDGIFVCLDNAEAWIKEAELVSKNSSYGHACALLFHGLESLVQAAVCYGVARDQLTIESPDFKKAFTEHKRKLELVLNTLVTGEIMDQILPKITKNKGFFEVIQELINQNLYLDEIEKVVEKRKVSFVKNIMRLRNEGIYVNFDNNQLKFTSPMDIKRKDYEELKEKVNYFYDRLLAIINFNEKLLSRL